MLTSALYLHGFASSSRSTKAVFLGERLAAYGATLRAPDFNQPDFSTLTVTRMLQQTAAARAELPPGPAALIGSSLVTFDRVVFDLLQVASLGSADLRAHDHVD